MNLNENGPFPELLLSLRRKLEESFDRNNDAVLFELSRKIDEIQLRRWTSNGIFPPSRIKE